MAIEEFLLKDVSVAYVSSQIPVLDGIELNIERGHWVSVVGPNGSGKSTVGKVLAGLLNISKGELTSKRPVTDGGVGSAVAARPDTSRVQMVFQNPDAQIVGTTVYEDICFGMENIGVPTEAMPEKARQALDSVGLHLNLKTPVEALSGGQKQLLCIAGCLVMNPSAIIFDEATSMLNPESRQRVLETVQSLHKSGITIIWITQWMDEVAYADRVIALRDGRMVFDGTPRAFFYPNDSGTTSERSSKVPAWDTTPCEALAFQPPYVVRLAKELIANGVPLYEKPMLEHELVKLAEELCR